MLLLLLLLLPLLLRLQLAIAAWTARCLTLLPLALAGHALRVQLRQQAVADRCWRGGFYGGICAVGQTCWLVLLRLGCWRRRCATRGDAALPVHPQGVLHDACTGCRGFLHSVLLLCVCRQVDGRAI
jgi:hypothetical protein